jgi:hypothetical protein
MACGDYVKCPTCEGIMIYGNAVCPRCMDKLGLFTPKFEPFDPALPTGGAASNLDRKSTLVVNLFAGPGAGKSTMCAGIFYDLKCLGINCEMAREYAKELVWEKRDFTFENQIYLFGKQHHRIFQLLGQNDVVITDCPLLLSPVYAGGKLAQFDPLVVEEHNKMWNYNVFLNRKKTFNPIGRRHDEEHSKMIDRQVLDVLDNRPYETFEASPEGKTAIVKKILLLLENKPSKSIS